MTAAIRLYVAKSDGEERTFRPIVRDDNEPLTATELLSAVSELLRALRLGNGDVRILFSSTLGNILWALLVLSLVLPVWRARRNKMRALANG